eukprot:ctg_730.g292
MNDFLGSRPSSAACSPCAPPRRERCSVQVGSCSAREVCRRCQRSVHQHVSSTTAGIQAAVESTCDAFGSAFQQEARIGEERRRPGETRRERIGTRITSGNDIMFVGALSAPRSAFVGKAATSALGGGVCAACRSAHRPSAATVRMADAGARHWTRRELLLGVGAAVLGTLLGRSLPAEAKGEPKMSFFGADAQSSPFTYNEVQETPIFGGLTADDLKKYRETVMSAKARIE